MGVFIKDNSLLYSAQRLGVVDVSSEVTFQLPSSPYAVYDGKAGASVGSATTWADSSGNNHHITLANALASDWDTDHFTSVVGTTRFATGTIYDDASVVTPVQTTLDVSNGFTFNALVHYNANGTKSAGAGIDVLMALAVTASGARSQLNIGARGTENANKMRYAVNNGSGWASPTVATDAQSDLGVGIHLLTWTVNASGNTVKMYYDGVLLGTYSPTKTITGTSPKMYFFGANLEPAAADNIYNFVGDVYAMSVYRRPLTADEVEACRLYYKQQYTNY